MSLGNRFVRSATNMNLANEDGSCSPGIIDTNRTLAENNVGLTITGFAYVQKSGRTAPRQLGCYTDEQIPGYKDLADAVHGAGGSIAMQIAHCGVLSNPDLTGEAPAGPSDMQVPNGPASRAMTIDEIHGTVNAFCAAAERAKKAGMDAVQIHAAHGYGLSQFLSPYFNKRNDEYGGTLENRSRILMQIVAGVIRTVGSDYPILAKINAEDRLEGGFTTEEMVAVCTMLQDAGVDAIEISGGTTLGLKMKRPNDSFSRVGKEEVVYWKEAAMAYKKEVKIPLILVGGIRSFETAEKLINEGMADYISMCRPFLREPDLIKRWENGNHEPSACISDNACFAAGARCVHRK